MFEMKILAPALAGIAAVVWGVVLMQERSDPAPAPAAVEAAAPAPATVATLDGASLLDGPRRGRLQGAQAGAVRPPLRRDDSGWTLPAADDPARAAWEAKHPMKRHALDPAQDAERRTYHQRWRQLSGPDRRALRRACQSQGLDRQDMNCLRMVDSSVPSTGAARQQQRRPGYGTPADRDRKRGQPAQPQPSGAEQDTIP